MNDKKTPPVSVWQMLNNQDKPIVIYGMGNGADKVINEFEKNSIAISGVIASDDFVRGQSFHGFVVEKLSDAEQRLGNFIIALTFATQIDSVIEHIKCISKKHHTVVPCVPVFGDDIFNLDFAIKNKESLQKAYNLMADEQSKEVFENTVLFLITGELEYLWKSQSTKDEAFKNILKLNENESYLDLGAYRGDTIEEFLKYTNNSYNTITALEPDAKNYKKLCAYAENFNNTNLYNLGIWNNDTEMFFESCSGRSATLFVAELDKKVTSLKVTSIDSLYQNAKLSYIKMDVEGAEEQALQGAVNTLQLQKPKLNIAAYHRSQDIFKLPIIINQINPDYKIYLRHHPYIPSWDTNLYCV